MCNRPYYRKGKPSEESLSPLQAEANPPLELEVNKRLNL